MDRRLIGTVVAAACFATASMGCARSNSEQPAGSTNMQSNGSSDPATAKGDAGGWNSLVSQNGNAGSGPAAASKEAGAQNASPTSQAIGNMGGSAAPGDK
ncbi:MAG: hypothetical protein M3O36_19410 [Myxococcota bacterium]|nr:hypothetical protein [Myxococcota bacterium]